MRIEDLGNHTIIKTGNLDANAEIHGGKYPFFTCSKESKQIDNYAFDGEFVVVAGNGDLNVKYYKGKFNAYQRTYAISPKETVNGKYLYYFLEKYLVKLRELSIGGVIKYIKIGNLTEAKIPLPPLPTQQKIASILDAADTLRQKDKALLAKYDELTQSLFLDMFGDPVKNEKGWEKVSLNSCLQNIEKIGKTFAEGIIEYVDIASVDNNRNIITAITTYQTIEKPSRAQQILKAGDIVFSTVRPNLKNIAINKVDGRIGSTGFFVCRVNPKKLKNFFLYKVLLTDSATDYFVGITSGANYPAIKSTDMKKFQVIIPPIELQNQFAQHVANIEQQKAIAQASLEKSEELFNSLLQKAFKGELV